MWVSSHTDVAPAADFTSAAPCLPGLPAWRRVTTWKIPPVYRKESRPGAQRPVDERKPCGFPLIPRVAPAADFTSAASCLPSLPAWRRVTTWKIPTVYRKESRPGAQRPVDERKPCVFPLIHRVAPAAD